MKKSFKKALSLLLVLVMIFALCVPAFAADADTAKTAYKYVSLGASNTNGYGLHGYWPLQMYDDPHSVFKDSTDDNLMLARDGYFTSGYYFYSDDAYPVLVKNSLQKQLGDKYDVQLKQCGINSMRAYDLLWMLDDTWPTDGYIEWRLGSETEGWKYDIERERHQTVSVEGWDDLVIDKGVTDLRQEFRDAVYNADFITYDLGVNDFGSYINNTLFVSEENSMIDCNLEYVMGEYADIYKVAKEKIMAIVNKALEGVDIDLTGLDINSFVDHILYAYLGFVQSFDRSMGLIYKNNPDVEVVVCGISNVFEGTTLTIAGIELPFGEIMGTTMDLANAYTALLSPYHNKYTFADCSVGGQHVEYFSNKMLSWDEEDVDDLHPCIIDAFSGYDWHFITPWITESTMMSYGATSYVDGVAQWNSPEVLAADKELHKYFTDRSNNAQYYLLAYFCKRALENSDMVVDSPVGLWYDFNTTLANMLFYGYTCKGTSYYGADGLGLWMDMSMEEIYALEREWVDDLLSDPQVRAAAFYYAYTTFAACFFSHPSAEGHVQIKDAIMNAYNNDISGIDNLILKLDDMDELVAEGVLKFGVEFSTSLVSKLASVFKIPTPIMNLIAKNSDSVATMLAVYGGLYREDLVDKLAKAVRDTYVSCDNCRHGHLAKVPAKHATIFSDGMAQYYVCKDCGAKFFDSAAKNLVLNDSDLVVTRIDAFRFLTNFIRDFITNGVFGNLKFGK